MTNHNRKDITRLFARLPRRERTKAKVDIDLPIHAYPVEAGNIEHDWLYATQCAFQRLHEQLLSAVRPRIGPFWACGSSQGVDAKLAWEILRPERLIVSDIVKECVTTSVDNILENCNDVANGQVRGYCGDLATPLIEAGEIVELAYGNLPVLPSNLTQQEICRSGFSAATFYPAGRANHTEEFVAFNLLELYYSFLMQSKQCLQPKGYAICVFGGRRRWEPIQRLFEVCGYRPQLLYFGLKPQAQDDVCLPAYRKLENAQRRFTYYSLPEALRAYSEFSNGTNCESLFLHGTDPDLWDVHDKLVNLLQDFEIDATTADQRRTKHALPSGHLVYVVAGQLNTI